MILSRVMAKNTMVKGRIPTLANLETQIWETEPVALASSLPIKKIISPAIVIAPIVVTNSAAAIVLIVVTVVTVTVMLLNGIV